MIMIPIKTLLISVNKGDGTQEQITQDEFRRRYPKVHAALHTPRDYITEGRRLKAIREKHNMSLQDVLERCDIPVSELNDVEQGRKPATQELIDAYGMLGLFVGVTVRGGG